MVTLAVTCGAALYEALPAWLAVKLHMPAETILAVLPETVHTPGVSEPNTTGLLDAPPVALRGKVAPAL